MFTWAHERFIAVLFAVFSFVALGLAAIGLASVVAYSVEQRTREFGIRTALGAPQWSVLVLTLGSTARTTGMGLILGAFSSASASAMPFIAGPRAVCAISLFSPSSQAYSLSPRPSPAFCPREEQPVSIP
jgi:ABC-type antimicrobial peptide transport system permease subunit